MAYSDSRDFEDAMIDYGFATGETEPIDFEDGDEDEDNEVSSFEDDCPMDGDAESALASCGWGTDEDYGDYGGDDPYSEW